jgi:hypothetical protein
MACAVIVLQLNKCHFRMQHCSGYSRKVRKFCVSFALYFIGAGDFFVE